MLINLDDHKNAPRNSEDTGLRRADKVLYMHADEAIKTAIRSYQEGHLQDAITQCEKILAARPDHADSLHLLGVIAHQSGRDPEAVELISRAICVNPDQPTYYYSMGNVFKNQGQLNDAIDCYQKALHLKPHFGQAQNNMGNAYYELGDLNRAIACYQSAIGVSPDYAEAYNNLANVLGEQGKPEEAISCYEKAIGYNPDNAVALNNKGLALRDLGRPDEALACFRKALQIDPDLAAAHNNMGATLQGLGQNEAAAACYQKSLQVRQDDGIEIKAALMLPVICYSNQSIQLARDRFDRHLDALLTRNLQITDPAKQIGTANFFLAYHGLCNKDLQKKIAAMHIRACPQLEWQAELNPAGKIKDSKIRLGIVSKFMYAHTIGNLNHGIIEHLDRQKFHVTLFRFAGRRDELAAAIDKAADEVVMLPNRWEPARRAIADKAVDILYYPDVGMDPLTYYLAFARLAPIQCTSWGHPDTTGIPNMDYYISSAVAEPPGAQEHYCERLVLLNNFAMYCRRPGLPQGKLARKDLGLSGHQNLYACIQSLFKVHPDFDEIIAGILRRDPDGIILFFEDKHMHWSRQLRKRFARKLPGAHHRIRFLKRLSPQYFLAFLQIPDVILDTLHFGGGYTSLLAFAAGRPIVTWPGEFMRGRLTYALYNQMGILDCVADDFGCYINTALKLAQDKAWQKEIRTKIAARSHVLFDNIEPVRELEYFFESCLGKSKTQEADDAQNDCREGDALKDRGMLKEAIRCYQNAIKKDPASAEALNKLGNAFQGRTAPEKALKCYQAAIRINPNFAEAYYNWGNLLKLGGQYPAAIEKYQTAVRLRPDFARAYCNMGVALKATGDFKAAVENFQHAIRLKPDFAEAYNNLGNVLNDDGQFTAAVAHFRKATALKPDYAEAFNNMGVAHFYQGQINKALDSYDTAIGFQPEFADAHWNRALAYLLAGRLREGFQEYEWRFLKSNWQAIYSRRYDIPRWDGTPFQGKRLYVHAEQGFGDTLQFIRYLPLVKELGGTVILEAKKPLHGLLRVMAGIDELVEGASSGQPAAACDFYIALLSLPAIFETTLETIPANHPYLFADPAKMETWRRRLQAEEFKIGIVWAGRPVVRTDPVGLSYRSCGLQWFAPLTEISGIRIYGLQNGHAKGDIEKSDLGDKIINLGAAFNDFSDTAAAIANLDLVISIDTAVAHLAGAMGKPTWLLLPRAADWRWLQERPDSPWYPSMRLFRQNKLGAWDNVFEQVCLALQSQVRLWLVNGRKIDA
jgi:predicted O-linked N-acetylglucosamine transferase (SPINDLY family)